MARDPKYDPLFEPIRLGPKTMKNRFFQTAQCNGAGSDRPGAQAGHRGMKAEGGWGALSTEYCSIHYESDTTPYISAQLWDEGDVVNLGAMCDALHKHGALANVELLYGGPHATNYMSRAVSWGPSAYPSDAEPLHYCVEADENDIADIIGYYVAAGKRAREAGFDILTVYFADSFLPMQFLHDFYNKRTDKYGGSFENRLRFTEELLTALKQALGDDCAIAARFAIDSLLGPEGIEAHGEGLKTVDRLTLAGLVDLWDFKIGIYSEWGEDLAPSRFQKSGHELAYVIDAKSATGDVPVVCVGHLTSPDEMVATLDAGHYDIIGATRASIADPFLPNKVEQGRLDDIRECIACNMCVSRWELAGPHIICTQNATAMEEYRRGWHPEQFAPAAEPCSVLVVGAGPAGLECARVLGMRGFDVHLREAGGELGGHLKDVMRYPGLSEWGRVITYRQTQLEKLKNVEVHSGVGAMSADDILGYGADKVVLATGSRWADDGFSGVTMEPLPGVDAAQAQFATPEQVMAGKELGERVIVFDGEGYITGIGMAEHLADAGKQVSVITQNHGVAPYLHYTGEASNLHRMMHEKGIHEHDMHWIESVETGNELTVRAFYLYRDGYRRTGPVPGQMPRRAGTEVIELACDSVVLCTARRANDGLYRELESRHSEWPDAELQAVYRVGDCLAPRMLPDAVFDGHRLAREFDGPTPEHSRPYIRERQIWGREAMPALQTAAS